MAETHSRTLHDRIFKEFLYRFLPEFLFIFFPDKAAQLDFTTLAFLDKELVINLPGQTLRITDVIAEVKTHNGEPEVIIIHIEVEAGDKKSLPKRLFEYFSLLELLKQKPVFPIALVLLPHVGGLKWATYAQQLFGQEILRFMYGQVGIRDLKGDEYLAQGNPVSAALSVLMRQKREYKAAHKLTALETIFGSGLTEGNKLFLMNLVDTYLPREQLLADARGEIMQALQEFEMTYHEKIAYKARQEGQREGKKALLIHLLEKKFGRLPQSFVTRINAITDDAVLDMLSEEMLTAVSLTDLHLPDIKPTQ